MKKLNIEFLMKDKTYVFLGFVLACLTYSFSVVSAQEVIKAETVAIVSESIPEEYMEELKSFTKESTVVVANNARLADVAQTIELDKALVAEKEPEEKVISSHSVPNEIKSCKSSRRNYYHWGKCILE